MPYVERDGARLFYEDGGGAGAAIVFSHGFLMDREMFALQVAVLREEFRCITWDQRGHGLTVSEGSFTYWDSARDLLGILDDVEVERAFLAGMSQGGFVSLRAALLGPERVRGLFLIDSQAGVEEASARPVYDRLFNDWVTNGPSGEVAATVAGIIVGPAEQRPWIEKWMSQPPDRPAEPYRALMERDDLTERLREIDCPALVVHGEDDMEIPLAKGRALCEGLPNCDGLVVVPGAGHASNLSHPEVVGEALRDFARRHAA